MAKETELSTRTVKRILAEFVAEGLLIIRKRGGAGAGVPTRYDFNMEAIARLKPATAPPAEVCHDDTLNGSEGCHPGTPNGIARVTPETFKGDTDSKEGCHAVTQSIRDPLTEPPEPPEEREGACRRDAGASPRSDDPA
ncbi:hypothetical protein [Sinorhizobium sp. CCBAU 05631]|uniref:hypothetical protein n=1 Tax=Sinorhizobium sp. CCBAU 05631 TaxID=794846 RepID=UPI001FCB2E63|nr:hypothetical protein [Sinorhizobium sp. CCBAU 05631]